MRFLSLCLFGVLLACAAPPAPRQNGLPQTIEALRASGLEVTPAGTVQQPFFAPPAQVVRVDGGDLQLYQFASPSEAAAAAATVSPTGGSIGTTKMAWMAPPHFFRKESLIAVYIGTSAKALAALQQNFGPQFAGQ